MRNKFSFFNPVTLCTSTNYTPHFSIKILLAGVKEHVLYKHMQPNYLGLVMVINN